MGWTVTTVCGLNYFLKEFRDIRIGRAVGKEAPDEVSAERPLICGGPPVLAETIVLEAIGRHGEIIEARLDCLQVPLNPWVWSSASLFKIRLYGTGAISRG